MLTNMDLGFLVALAGFAWAWFLSPWLFERIAAHGASTEPRASLTAVLVMVACLGVPVIIVSAGVWIWAQ